MRIAAVDPNTAPHALGELLRYWRGVRGVSQLELSLEAGVSQRQISFIESGRSVPGRETLLALARTLQVPLRERNALFLAAGYAPAYSEAPWNAQEMQRVVGTLERVLRQHEPFPAIVLDRHWNVLMSNEAAPRLFGHFVDLAARETPRNLLHLIFDPEGLRPFVEHWDDVARSLLQRVYREAVGQVIDGRTQGLLDALLAYPGVPRDWKTDRSATLPSSLPFVPIGLVDGDVTLRYFSLVSTVGTPQTVAAQELRLECMYPADDATEAAHQRRFAAPVARH